MKLLGRLALVGTLAVGCGAPQQAATRDGEAARSIAASTAGCRAAIAKLGRIVDSFHLEIADRQGMLSREEGARLATHMDIGIREMGQACRGVDMGSANDPILPALEALQVKIRKLEVLVADPSAGSHRADEYK